MPDGIVQWFDPKREEGRILRGSRTFTVRADAMEPSIRVAGIRVHFDIARADRDEAVNVTATRGRRSSRHHRRVGNLSGSRAHPPPGLGEPAEQAYGLTPTSATAALPPIQVSTGGDVPRSARDYAVEKVGRVFHTIDDPVLYARLRLEQAANPAMERPAMARVNLDLNGEPVRAHVAGRTMTEAVDLLEERLRRRLEALAEHRLALRHRGPASPAGTWRHGDFPTARPEFFPRPAAERRVVRHKTFSTPEASVDEAIFDMEAMDYDFFLFRDLATGKDAFVHRRTGGGYGLGRVETLPEHEVDWPAGAAVGVDPAPAPRLSIGEARERLDAGHEPWVFFQDAVSRRGHVLYRRYDGHYGLLTPVDEDIDLESVDLRAEEQAPR